MKSRKSSDLPKNNGSAERGKPRTCWDLSLTLGLPFSRWGAAPIVVSPIPYGAPQVGRNEPPANGASSRDIHPFLLAETWQDQMLADKQLTQASIAKREGLSRARVTQIMNLLRLPAEIQDQLRNPPASLNHAAFSERRLRSILRETDVSGQLSRWWAGLAEFP